MLGLVIEEVKQIRGEGELELLVRTSARGWRDAGDQGMLADLDVDEDLVPEWLDHIDEGIDPVLLGAV